MVKNIMADGSIIPDLTGHVVKPEEASGAYDLMEQINGGKTHEGKNLKNRID